MREGASRRGEERGSREREEGGGRRGERERERERTRSRKKSTNLFYKGCTLGSVKHVKGLVLAKLLMSGVGVGGHDDHRVSVWAVVHEAHTTCRREVSGQ